MKDPAVYRLVVDLTTDDLSEKGVLEAGIKELKARLEDAKKTEINDTAAKDIYSIYQSQIKAGFSSKQAFDLVLKMMDRAQAY